MATVSIIIPVRNRAKYLPRLFRSLTALTYRDVEIVLVDNGSSDASLSMCHAFAQEASMHVTVLEEPRCGACQARNMGLEYCSSEWVYFFDCDDELSPAFIEDVLSNASNADMVAIPTKEDVGGQVRQRSFRPSPSVASQILSSTLNTSGMFFRTAFLRKIGGWDESLGVWQDWELGIRVLLCKPNICWLPKKAYHRIYVHPDSITGASMASNLALRLHTLDVVEHEIATASARRALFFRYAILNGMLRREGSAMRAKYISVTWPCRLLGRFLELYTAMGGRGAWRIALMFVAVNESIAIGSE